MGQIIDFIQKKTERDLAREASIKAYEDGLKLAMIHLMNKVYAKRAIESGLVEGGQSDE